MPFEASSSLRLVLLGCALLVSRFGFSQTTNSFFQFVQDQGERRYTKVPHEVLAVFYGWYGPGQGGWLGVIDTNKHQIGNTARYPVKGPYSTHDPELLDWQIDQAKAHGITGFVASWMGRGTPGAWIDQSLDLLLQRAEKKGFKVAAYWESVPPEGPQLDIAVDDLTYLLTRYGTNTAYLKVNGKPVIFVYSRVLVQIPIPAWPEIILRARAKVGDFILIGEGFHDSLEFMFDGLHLFGGPTEEDLVKRRTLYARLYSDGVIAARSRGRISVVTVGAGYDDRKQNKEGWMADRQDGKVYRTLWEEALKAKADWVLISTWNEWPEGSEIEPSVELGDQYLKITREYALPFLRQPPVSVATTLPPPRLSPGTTQRVDRLFAGRTLGLLPGATWELRFWLSYCGADVRQLTWTNVIDPDFDFPVVIYPDNDHFISSARITDDITRALVRYHSGGGFLVMLPSAPWPFLYDDSRGGRPAAISDTLATGLTGWKETPPEVVLTFHARTNILFGMPVKVPFPNTGDRRFVATTKTRVPAADIYVPIVQLRDNKGGIQGDAVTYIEHRQPPLVPGKTLYSWMRMPELFGKPEFLLSLFQFVSSRLTPLREQ